VTKPNSLTLGSLFDGIGGFPYAASFYNITPLWASEILSTGVSVTRRHFPDMAHVGDITQLDGGKLPPVDIITFGSPCQGLSMAGRRLGLADERSGLFSEAIRIIREMQEATNGEYPKIALWENVPGALSTAGGHDFRAVIEAFTASKVPMPESGKWANAGMVRSRSVDIAWCVYNAQYFGTAQRRRRIFLIADFTGRRAGEILFVPKSLRRYFEAGGTPRQAAAAYAQNSSGTADVQPCIGFDGYNSTLTGNQASTLGINCGMSTGRNGVLSPQIDILNDQGGDSLTVEKNGISPTIRCETHGNLPVIAHPQKNNCLNGWDTQQSRVFTDDGQAPTLAGADGGGGRNPAGLIFAAFMGGQSPSSGSIAYSEKVAPTLKSANSGSNMVPCICEPASEAEVYPINTQLATRGNKLGNGTGFGIGENGDPAYTLQEAHSHAVAYDKEQLLCAATGQANAEVLENRCTTIVAGHEQPYIAHPKGGEAYGFDLQQITSKQNRTSLKEVQPVLCSAGNPHVITTHPKVSGTLCGSGAGLSRTAGMASETDLCIVQEAIPIHDKATRCNGGGPSRKNDGSGNGLGVGKNGDPAPTITAGDRHGVTYCLQGSMVGRAEQNGPQGSGINEDICFTLNTIDHHAVSAVDCRNLKENGDLSGTLQSKTTAGYSLNYQNPVRIHYIVRRLTPTECERLQGYPDGWTEYGHDEKPISDTKRYQMLGNSVAVPCVAYIMEGISTALLSERR